MVDDDELELADLSAGSRRADGASRAHRSTRDTMPVGPTTHCPGTWQPSPDVGSGEAPVDPEKIPRQNRLLSGRDERSLHAACHVRAVRAFRLRASQGRAE